MYLCWIRLAESVELTAREHRITCSLIKVERHCWTAAGEGWALQVQEEIMLWEEGLSFSVHEKNQIKHLSSSLIKMVCLNIMNQSRFKNEIAIIFSHIEFDEKLTNS